MGEEGSVLLDSNGWAKKRGLRWRPMAGQIAGSPDRIPLRIEVQRVERRRKLSAFILVLPLLLFIVVSFILPLGRMIVQRNR